MKNQKLFPFSSKQNIQNVNHRRVQTTVILIITVLAMLLLLTSCAGSTSGADKLAQGQAEADAANNQAGKTSAESQISESLAPTTVVTSEATTSTQPAPTTSLTVQPKETTSKPTAKPTAKPTLPATVSTTSAETAATTKVTVPTVAKALAGTGKINILLIGSDARAGLEGQRSDTTMLLTYNRDTRQIKLTSFMRDCYVAIPGHGSSKMNAAFNYAGESLLIDTIRANFAVDVSNYVTIRFEQFVAVVDQIGGITLNLSQKEIDWINGDAGGVSNGDGVKVLNGAQALSHSRNRYVGNGDFTRTERQRTVIKAIFSKIKQNNNAASLAALVGFALGNVNTNVPADQLLTLATDVLLSGDVSFSEARVPFDGTWSYATIKGASVIKVDFAANNENLRAFLDS